MADDEEGRLRELFDTEVRRKSRELEELISIGREAGFAPRTSLARTPPHGFSSPAATVDVSTDGARPYKRPITSPEEEQERTRRCDESRTVSRPALPPVAGILTAPKANSASEQSHSAEPAAVIPAENGLISMTKIQMLDTVQNSLRRIAEVSNVMVSATKFKMNAAERDAINQASQNVLAVVAALELKLAESEHEVTATKLKCAQLELSLTSGNPANISSFSSVTPPAPTYASLLKRPKGQPTVAITANQSQAVLFYPNTEDIKTSEGTKAELQKAVKPGRLGIPVQSIRRIGNSGIAVRAATPAAAEKLKAAAPPTLKASEPKARRPLVAIRNLRTDPTEDSLLDDLQATNLAEDPEWTKEKVRSSCKVAYKKGGRNGRRTTVVLECTPALRDKLVGLGRVYIGWDEADICDYLRITCCTKCQQFGHPEKYCRATEMVCGKCGDTGHRRSECQSQSECCATCKRFKRKEAGTHVTNATTCPARMYAEQQAANMTQYG